MRFGLVPVLCFVGWCSACTPAFLSKYSSGRNNEVQATAGANAAPPSSAAKAGATSAPAAPRPVRPTIFAVDHGTFRFQLGYDRVWDATLDVLLRNYNLAIADRNNGLITTEWDSYYLEGKVHRNKVSLRVKRMAGSLVEVTIFNNVEMLSKLPAGGITEIWLPTDKNKAEIGRIVQNMAIAMGQPRPELPQELMAGSVPAAEKSRL
ncbi:MAG TPA: hypothetical protein VE954_26810 [Oligoflexus sp.]|uniref:hypothetical protein n=1 Tax=Oligoflexus sp. TaxID=1971216 RepID=UPI002D4F4666|nr:hypothetical protein [Oligoflexus sp.]HYX36735.1 hypothetical protein [Oligoflexus sp.]